MAESQERAKSKSAPAPAPEPYRPSVMTTPIVANPTVQGDEFGDGEEPPRRRDRFEQQIPTFGDPSKTCWNVLVRHTTFYLKQANVHAASREEAKRIFLEQARERHQQIANRQKGPNVEKDRQRVWDAYNHGVQHQLKGGWIIQSAEEAKAKREAVRDRYNRRWARDEEREHDKAKSNMA